MKIFISWSGPVSRDVAHAVKGWLKLILQATDPWISDDTTKGKIWFGEISKEIKASKYGVVCVTAENKREPWLLWEAGALYGGFAREQLVVPLLINLKKSDVGPPLNQFQMIEATDRGDVTDWLKGINLTLGGSAITEQQLEKLVDAFWKDLQDAIATAIKDHPVTLKASGVERTFKEAADRYLDDLKARGKKSSKRYLSSLRHLAPYLNDMPLSQVDENVLEQYRADRLSGKLRGVGARGPAMMGTVNKDVQLVRQILNRAKSLRWISQVPDIRLNTGDTKQPHILSWPDQEAVFSYIPKYAVPAYEFAVNTGLRRDEVANLKWSQEVQLPNRNTTYFSVPLGHRAQGKMRSVPLNSIAKRVIDGQRGKNKDYVFTNFRNKQYYNYGVKHWNTAWKRAKLPSGKLISKGVENLRKTFEFRLRSAKVPEAEIDILLGSTKGTVLERTAGIPVGPLIDLVELITVRDDSPIHQTHGQIANPVKGAWQRKNAKRKVKAEVPDPSTFELTPA